MKKIDVFQEFKTAEMKHLQVLYLNKHKFTFEEIEKWTGYCKITIKIYLKKFADLLDKACKTFYHITEKIKQVILGGKQLVYLFKFYDEDNKLICSKVGTTTRLPEKRLNEEIKYYQKHGIPVASTKICSVIDCGDIPAEGAESVARGKFIMRWPKAFKKNDRFFDVDIPTKYFNKVINNYLTGV